MKKCREEWEKKDAEMIVIEIWGEGRKGDEDEEREVK